MTTARTPVRLATLLALAVLLPAASATATTGETPDGSRSGLGWVALGLAVTAIIGILVLTRRKKKR